MYSELVSLCQNHTRHELYAAQCDIVYGTTRIWALMGSSTRDPKRYLDPKRHAYDLMATIVFGHNSSILDSGFHQQDRSIYEVYRLWSAIVDIRVWIWALMGLSIRDPKSNLDPKRHACNLTDRKESVVFGHRSCIFESVFQHQDPEIQ